MRLLYGGRYGPGGPGRLGSPHPGATVRVPAINVRDLEASAPKECGDSSLRAAIVGGTLKPSGSLKLPDAAPDGGGIDAERLGQLLVPEPARLPLPHAFEQEAADDLGLRGEPWVFE